MSTTWRENYSFPRIFKGVGSAPDPAEVLGSSGHETLSPDKLFPGWRTVKRKENSARGPRCRLRVQLRCREKTHIQVQEC